MRAALLAVAALLAAAAPPEPASLLTPDDLDPKLVLPPPPAAASPQARAELAELHAIEAARTPEDEAAARLDGETKNAAIFAAAIGPAFDLSRLPATSHVLAVVRATEKNVVDRGKDEFRRPRPYAVDPTLKPCKQNSDPLSSYPSGHTSMAYAMGEVLARLIPGRAPAILARAARYAQSRIVCEQHFRSDVTAGEALGTIVAERLMAKPAFVAAFRAADSELASTGLK